MRSQWAYQLAHRYGPHAHLDVALSFMPHLWRLNIDKLAEEVGRSDEVFIKHLKTTYAEPLPPVWAVCEVMTLGLLSRWYNNPKPMPARRAIAMEYGVDEKVWASWLRHLSLIRNTCAHHCRLGTGSSQSPRFCIGTSRQRCAMDSSMAPASSTTPWSSWRTVCGGLREGKAGVPISRS